MSMVRYKRGETPKLTEEYKTEVEALFKKPDTDIDCSDIPELDDEFLIRAIRSPLYKPTKTGTYIRLDADVLEWFKRKGRGYQTRINAGLREIMIRELQHQTN